MFDWTRKSRGVVVAVLYSFAINASPASGADDVAGVVNGTAVTMAEVDAPIAAKVHALEQQIHALRMSSLDALINNALIADEARRLQITPAELKSRYTDVEAVVPDSDIDREYTANISAFGSMSIDEARERIRIDLQSGARMRAYRASVEALRSRAEVEVRLAPPRMAAVDYAAAAAPARGNPDAAVVITEFGDYECPYCKSAHDALTEILRLYPDDVRLEFRHFPLEGHALAMPVARRAVCAARQGRFWELHNALFANARLSESAIAAAVDASGLDKTALDRCVAADDSLNAVLRDVMLAKRAGATGTPTFVINGRLLRGAHDLQSLQKAVASELTAVRREHAASTVKGGK